MADLLIVDDDSDLGDLLGQALVDEGHQVRIARNGKEGLRLVAERAPDLVLLDVEMPVLDGPDMAYQMFLRNCGDEKIPIILVSGNVDLPRSAAAVGTPYFLAKPYDADAVVAIVDRALTERIPPAPRVPEVRA